MSKFREDSLLWKIPGKLRRIEGSKEFSRRNLVSCRFYPVVCQTHLTLQGAEVCLESSRGDSLP